MKKPRASRKTLGRSSKTPGMEVSIRRTEFGLLQKNRDADQLNKQLDHFSSIRTQLQRPEYSKNELTRRLSPGLRDRVERRVAILVVFLVISEVLAAAYSREPFVVGAIPINRLAQTVFERDRGFPAEFPLDFRAREGIAAIVAGAIFHGSKQRFCFSRGAKQTARHGEIFDDVRAADVVNLADSSVLQDRQNCAAMIRHVKPIAFLPTVAVNGEGLVVQRIRNHERQKFFGELVRPVIVGGARDDRRKRKGANVGPDNQVGAGFRGGVRTVRL